MSFAAFTLTELITLRAGLDHLSEQQSGSLMRKLQAEIAFRQHRIHSTLPHWTTTRKEDDPREFCPECQAQYRGSVLRAHGGHL